MRATAARRWVERIVLFACLVLFAVALASSDLRSAAARLRELGALAVLVLLPFPIGLACDALAWRRLLAGLERHVRLRDVLRVRFASEAVANSAPAGAVWAEAVAPVLLSQRTGVPVADAAATSATKRWLLVRTHGIYVALGATLGTASLVAASRELIGSDALVAAVVAGALVLVVMSLAAESIAVRGQLAARAAGALGKAHFLRLATWIENRRHHFLKWDAQITRLSDDPEATSAATIRVLGLWLVEGFDTFLILRLLGADLSLFAVMSFDAALSVVRSAAVFAPSGIGVQDVGYLAVLEAYGVHESTGIGAAFVLVKRAKEAIYVALGLLILAFQRGAQRPSAAT